MTAKFNTAADLLVHYATVKARLGGSPAKPVVNMEAIRPAKQETPVIEVKRIPVPLKIMPVPTVAIRPEDVKITFDEVKALVCANTGYHSRELFANRRFKDLCEVRHLAWSLARKFCVHMSLPQIGRASGGRDHTTILHGCKKGIYHELYESLCMELEALLDRKIAANAKLIEEAEKEKEGA